MIKIDKDTELEAVRLYKSGKSARKTGDIVGINDMTVLRILRDYNIDRRSNTDYKKYKLNEDYFSEIDTPNKAYMLGFLFADGNVHKSKYYLAIELSAKDKEILFFIIDELEYETKPKIYNRELEGSIYKKLVVSSKSICGDLIKHGCIPNKTLVLKYPNIPDELNRHFIRGYFDGDGTVTSFKSKRHMRIVSTIEFLNIMYIILNKEIGIKMNKIVEYSRNNKIGYLTVSANVEFVKFYDYIYSDNSFCLRRKYDKFLKLAELAKKSKRFGWNKTSKYVGVCFDKNRNKWMATFKKEQLGRFDTEEKAYKRRKEHEKISYNTKSIGC